MSSVFSSSDSITQNQSSIANTDLVALHEIWNDQQRERCLRWITKKALRRVGLQFPDNVMRHSTFIVKDLHTGLCDDLHIFILGDTSYGSCCVDEIAASHASADGIIHFGHACLSKVARVPVLYVFFNYTLDEKDLLAALERRFIDNSTRFTCFYEVSYAEAVLKVQHIIKKQFPHSIVANLAEADQEADKLCWKFEVPHASDCPAVYIGRDNLSFFNTAVALDTSQWYLYNPTRKDADIERKDAVEAQWLRRRYYAIERCKDAGSIGIVVATLSTKGYMDIVTRLQRLAKARGVRSYIISIGKVNPEKLANFCDIECFVLVGCPENDIFTSRDFFRPLLSVFEAEMALNPAWKERLCQKYTTNFADLLPAGCLYSDIEAISLLIEQENDVPDVSLITGKARGSSRANNDDTALANDCKDLTLRGKNEVALISSANDLANRSWQGLEQNLGQDEPALIEDGRSGIPIRYVNDPNSN